MTDTPTTLDTDAAELRLPSPAELAAWFDASTYAATEIRLTTWLDELPGVPGSVAPYLCLAPVTAGPVMGLTASKLGLGRFTGPLPVYAIGAGVTISDSRAQLVVMGLRPFPPLDVPVEWLDAARQSSQAVILASEVPLSDQELDVPAAQLWGAVVPLAWL